MQKQAPIDAKSLITALNNEAELLRKRQKRSTYSSIHKCERLVCLYPIDYGGNVQVSAPGEEPGPLSVSCRCERFGTQLRTGDKQRVEQGTLSDTVCHCIALCFSDILGDEVDVHRSEQQRVAAAVSSGILCAIHRESTFMHSNLR
jgi:hypothetical protein